MVILVDRVLRSIRTTDPVLIVGAAALAATPVDTLELAIDRYRLVKARVAGVFAVLEHLLTVHAVGLDEHVVQTVNLHGLTVHGHLEGGFRSSLRLLPVERLAVRPGEHLHVLLRRAVAHTRVGDEVGPGITVTAGGGHDAVAVDDLRAALEQVGSAESIGVVLLRVAGRHHEVVGIAGGGVPFEEFLAGILEGGPAAGVVIAIPHRAGILHRVLAVVVRLVGVEQRGGGELQDLALEGQGRGDGPAAGLRVSLVRAGIAPHQVVALDRGIEQIDHELHGLIHARARQVILVFRSSVCALDKRQASVETESDEIEACQQAAGLVFHPLLLVVGQARHIVDVLHEDPAVADVLPDVLVEIGVDGAVVIGLVRRGQRTRVVFVVHDGVREEEMVGVGQCVRDALPVVEALGRRVGRRRRQRIVLHPVDVGQEPAGVFGVGEHRICRDRATRSLLKESVAHLERIRAGIDAEAERSRCSNRYDGFVKVFHGILEIKLQTERDGAGQRVGRIRTGLGFRIAPDVRSDG